MTCEHDALRPDCPTCDGTGRVPNPTDYYIIEGLWKCPDCVDGQVTIEQLAATWRAVWELPQLERNDVSSADCIAYLRRVKP